MNKELWVGYSEKEKSFFLGYYVHLLTDAVEGKRLLTLPCSVSVNCLKRIRMLYGS